MIPDDVFITKQMISLSAIKESIREEISFAPTRYNKRTFIEVYLNNWYKKTMKQKKWGTDFKYDYLDIGSSFFEISFQDENVREGIYDTDGWNREIWEKIDFMLNRAKMEKDFDALLDEIKNKKIFPIQINDFRYSVMEFLIEFDIISPNEEMREQLERMETKLLPKMKSFYEEKRS